MMPSGREILALPAKPRSSYYFTSLSVVLLFSVFIFTPVYIFGELPEINIFAMMFITALFTIISTIAKRNMFTFFNSICFFLFIYPFYMQSVFRVRFTGGGDIDLTPQAFLLFGSFLLIVNFVGLFGSNLETSYISRSRRADHHTARMGGFKAFLVGATTAGLILLLFGYVEIFLPRQKAILYGIPKLGSYQRFALDMLRMIPFWALYFYINSNHRGSRARIILGAMPILFLAILMCNPYNTQRLLSLSGLVIIFLALVRAGWLRSLWQNSYAFVAAGLVLLPATSVMRSGAVKLDIRELVDMLFSLEFSAFTIFNDLFLINYSTNTGPVRLLSAVLIFVPRDLWPSKSQGTGNSVAEAAGYAWYNVGIPPIADAYLDFGFVGVVLLALAIGLVLRYASSALAPSAVRDNGLAAGVKVSLIALTPILLRGNLSTFFVAFYGTMIAFAIAKFFDRVTLRRALGTDEWHERPASP